MKEVGGEEVVLLPLYRQLGWFDRARGSGHKVKKTVSITPGTHQRIIC